MPFAIGVRDRVMASQRFDIAELKPWVEVRFSRSPGPGGQNVNKVNTQVTLLFDCASCDQLSGRETGRIRRRLRTRLSHDGRLRVVSRRERTQVGNRRAAFQRLIELLTEAVHVSKVRKPTKPTAGSKRRRLDEKRRRSLRKRERGGRGIDAQ